MVILVVGCCLVVSYFLRWGQCVWDSAKDSRSQKSRSSVQDALAFHDIFPCFVRLYAFLYKLAVSPPPRCLQWEAGGRGHDASVSSPVAMDKEIALLFVWPDCWTQLFIMHVVLINLIDNDVIITAWSAGSKFWNHQLQPWRLRWLWMWLWWSQLWMRPSSTAAHSPTYMWTNVCMPTKNKEEESSDFEDVWECIWWAMRAHTIATHGKSQQTPGITCLSSLMGPWAS